MAKIYSKSARIPVKIDDVIVKIAPLSLEDKTEAQTLMAKGRINKDYGMLQKGIITLIKCAVKDISGVEDQDGNPYKLSFEDNKLTDDCVDDLFNLEMHKKLVMVCSSLVGAIPSEFVDESGKPIEGVEILKDSKSKKEETPDPN